MSSWNTICLVYIWTSLVIKLSMSIIHQMFISYINCTTSTCVMYAKRWDRMDVNSANIEVFYDISSSWNNFFNFLTKLRHCFKSFSNFGSELKLCFKNFLNFCSELRLRFKNLCNFWSELKRYFKRFYNFWFVLRLCINFFFEFLIWTINFSYTFMGHPISFSSY